MFSWIHTKRVRKYHYKTAAQAKEIFLLQCTFLWQVVASQSSARKKKGRKKLLLSQIKWLRNFAGEEKITEVFIICLHPHKFVLFLCCLEFFSVIGRKGKECKESKIQIFQTCVVHSWRFSSCFDKSSTQWVAKTRKTDITPYRQECN